MAIIMNINSLKLIYFSPTQTTRKIVEGIAQGIQIAEVEHVDLTPPDTRMRKLMEMHRNELAIIGSPVYTGRLPTDAIHRLQRLRGNNTPAVIVVIYGNRAYEDALLELRDVASKAGFKPVAAGVFIGEHSLSNNATPIAAGRPDAEDLRKANEFGKMIHQKIRNMQAPDEMSLLQVPGNSPYREPTVLPKISPVTQEIVCTKCEKCAQVCPTAAITVKDTVVTDQGACIRCCACIKTCPTGARMMEDPRMRQKAEQLSINCRERKEPETYM
jgi:Fe-S-cluster-containing hydrogenase component 2